MPITTYHVVTRWRLRASRAEVAAILAHPEMLPSWWPATFLDVREIEPGGVGQLGRTVSVHARSPLGYRLRYEGRLTACRFPASAQARVSGDFDGTCTGRLREDGEHVLVSFDWSVTVRKPLLRWLSWLLRPAFLASHRWAMRQGQGGLERELLRRRAPLLVAPVTLP